MKGFLRMMKHRGLDPVEYFFVMANYPVSKKKSDALPATETISETSVNSLLGKKIRLSFTEEIRCVDCGKITKKSFSQGSCFNCFMKLASNDMCIMKPETCHFHLGTCREPEWGKANCFKKHTIYVANTSGVKIGITKENPPSKRWVDQGAMYAIPILQVETRKQAGEIEIEYAKSISDKTSWQKMVSSDSIEVDLHSTKEKLFALKNPKEIVETVKFESGSEVIKINYPIVKYPKKAASYKLSKEKPIEDILVGIKGQYLLFENAVFNIRSHSGYYCEIDIV